MTTVPRPRGAPSPDRSTNVQATCSTAHPSRSAATWSGTSRRGPASRTPGSDTAGQSCPPRRAASPCRSIPRSRSIASTGCNEGQPCATCSADDPRRQSAVALWCFRLAVDVHPSLIAAPILDSYRLPSIDTGPSFTVRDTDSDSDSVTIDFSGLDLRPEQRLKLPPVRLLVDALEGSVLDCTWKATAGNVPRRLTGRFSLSVRPSLLRAHARQAAQGDGLSEVPDRR